METGYGLILAAKEAHAVRENDMSPRWRLRGLRWSYCAFIAAASISAAASALHGLHEGSHGPQMILALAATETIAALALAIEPVEVIACAVLLIVYCVAGAVSVVSADWVAVLRFIFYAATAAYIVLASRVNKRVAPAAVRDTLMAP
jgi:hypothetical protein